MIRFAAPFAGLLFGIWLGSPIGAMSRDAAQTPAPPAAAPTNAVLIGQVVDAATGNPVPDAIVTLTGRPSPSRGRGAGVPATGNMFDLIAAASAGRGNLERVAVDSEGRFVFHRLPASTYTVRAQATGYLSDYSGPIGLDSGPPTVEIRTGQTAARVRVRLWKEAVLTGIVVDEGSEPVIRARVSAYRRTIGRFGTITYDSPRSAATDDRGEYRMFGLAPGDYLVAVPQSHSTVLAAAADALMQGLVSGQMDMKQMASLGRGGSPMDPRAVRIGEWRLSSDNVRAPAAAGDGPIAAYRTVYYPSALTAASAQSVTLRSGEERSGVNFAVEPVVTGRVTGIVVGPAGPVGGVPVRLTAAGDRILGAASLPAVAETQTGADGRFTMLAVPPGQYRVIAEREAMDMPDDMPEEVASNPLMKMVLAMRGSSAPLYGEATVGLGGGESADVSIAVSEGVEVTGQLEFEGGPPPDPAATARARIILRALDGARSARTTRADEKGRFSVRGVLPGRYAAASTIVDGAATWLIRGVSANARDVTNVPIVVEDKKIELTVRLTNLVGTLRGTVRRESRQGLAPDAAAPPPLTVIVVPANYMEWRDLEIAIERVRFVTVGQDDTFRVGPLLTGEYLVAVVDEREIDLGRGLAALSLVASQATRVRVAAGDATSVTVGVAGSRR
jgi:protocatechuate 3,4-dioxygenase beta subunit